MYHISLLIVYGHDSVHIVKRKALLDRILQHNGVIQISCKTTLDLYMELGTLFIKVELRLGLLLNCKGFLFVLFALAISHQDELTHESRVERLVPIRSLHCGNRPFSVSR